MASLDITSNTEVPIAESWELSDREDGGSVVANGALRGRPLRELVEHYGSDLVGQNFQGGRFPHLFRPLKRVAAHCRAMNIHVEAQHSKNGKSAQVPLLQTLVTDLIKWKIHKNGQDPVFKLNHHVLRHFKTDLEFAGIPLVDKAGKVKVFVLSSFRVKESKFISGHKFVIITNSSILII